MSQKLLILISGKVGAGKTQAATLIEEIYSPFVMPLSHPLKNITISLKNLADGTKLTYSECEILKDNREYDFLNDKNYRETLYRTAIILKREFGEDIFPRLFLKNWLESGKQIGLVPDVREEEYNFFKTLCTGQNIQILHFVLEGPQRDRNYVSFSSYCRVPRDEKSVVINNIATIFDLESRLKSFIDEYLKNLAYLFPNLNLGLGVKEFSSTAMNAGIPSIPTPATKDEVKFITRMVLSELQEMHLTVFPSEERNQEKLNSFMKECLEEVDVPKKMLTSFDSEQEIVIEQYDALADAIYYMYDFSCRHGVNLDILLEEIHSSNMAKKWHDGSFHKRTDGKVLKPPGWQEPNIKKCLERPQF